MSTQSSVQLYLNWTKARSDEMDAAFNPIEGRAAELTVSAREKADHVLADLHKTRDNFRDDVINQVEANEATWKSVKTQLESEWTAFQAEVNKNLKSFGKQIAVLHGSPRHPCRPSASDSPRRRRNRARTSDNSSSQTLLLPIQILALATHWPLVPR